MNFILFYDCCCCVSVGRLCGSIMYSIASRFSLSLFSSFPFRTNNRLLICNEFSWARPSAIITRTMSRTNVSVVCVCLLPPSMRCHVWMCVEKRNERTDGRIDSTLVQCSVTLAGGIYAHDCVTRNPRRGGMIKKNCRFFVVVRKPFFSDWMDRK